MLCFLPNIFKSTKLLQTILQGSRLNFLQILPELEKLVGTLKLKAEKLEEPQGCYFSHLEEFIFVASKSAGIRFTTCSSAEFNVDLFVSNTSQRIIQKKIWAHWFYAKQKTHAKGT